MLHFVLMNQVVVAKFTNFVLFAAPCLLLNKRLMIKESCVSVFTSACQDEGITWNISDNYHF